MKACGGHHHVDRCIVGLNGERRQQLDIKGQADHERGPSGCQQAVIESAALPETVAAGGVVMAADAPLADWCAALARMWDERACYDRLAAAARAAAMAQTRALETVLDQWEALFRAAKA